MTPPPRGPRRSASSGPDPWIAARRRKRRRERIKHRRHRRAILIGLFVLVPVALLVVVGIGGTAAFGASCDLNSLRPVGIGQNSFVYAADGSVLGAIPAERNRTPVSRKEISPWMPKATVAIEDHRFYHHGAIDYQGTLRALIADIRAGHAVQGGSTITQQLVRNLYISREKTLQRKIKEACLAIKLFRRWSKDRILTAYMNQVYYGNHAYGIEAAAETYFSRSAKDLTLAQSAMLAGLPRAPSVYDPFHRPVDVLGRRDDVLRAMLDNGMITSTQFVEVQSDRDLHLKPGRRYTRIREPYFFTYVEDALQQQYGSSTVRSGGLKVYTTIDPRLQRAAQSAIKRVLTYSSDPSSAIVAIDPRNGAIRAMTAVTPGRTGNKFNLVSQARRQPGSTFKVVVLTTAVAMGINPNSTYYLSAPLHYQPDPTCNPSDPNCAWDVQTYDHSYLGATSIENATVHSDNTVFARLILDVGPDKVVKMAYKLGVRSSTLDAVPSLTLGSVGVSPLEMASVYSTLAAGGVYSRPMAITKVVLPNGKEDKDTGWGKPHRERVISDGVAYTVTQVLEQNMLHGTGTGAYFGRTSAGKTGTTDNYADAWFCGYVPQLEASVWVGYPKAEIPMLSVHGIAVSGPTFPAQIWHYFMETAVGNQAPLDFPPPTTQPVWIPFRGQYQYGGASGFTSSSSTDTTGTTTGGATTTAPAPTLKIETVGPATTQPPAPTPAPTPVPSPAPAPSPTPTVAPPPPPPQQRPDGGYTTP